MRRGFVSSSVLIFVLVMCAASALTSEPKNSNPAVVQTTNSRCTQLRYEARRNGKKPRLSSRRVFAFRDDRGPMTRCPRLSSSPRAGEFLPNSPPKVGLSASTAYLSMNSGSEVKLKAIACDREDDELLYVYSTTGGRISGDGANTVWDLKGVIPGTYIATVEVDDGCGCISFETARVVVAAP